MRAPALGRPSRRRRRCAACGSLCRQVTGPPRAAGRTPTLQLRSREPFFPPTPPKGFLHAPAPTPQTMAACNACGGHPHVWTSDCAKVQGEPCGGQQSAAAAAYQFVFKLSVPPAYLMQRWRGFRPAGPRSRTGYKYSCKFNKWYHSCCNCLSVNTSLRPALCVSLMLVFVRGGGG